MSLIDLSDDDAQFQDDLAKAIAASLEAPAAVDGNGAWGAILSASEAALGPDDADADLAAALAASMQSVAEDKMRRRKHVSGGALSVLGPAELAGGSGLGLGLGLSSRTASPTPCLAPQQAGPAPSASASAFAAASAVQPGWGAPRQPQPQQQLVHIAPQACINAPRLAAACSLGLGLSQPAAAQLSALAMLGTSPGKHTRTASLDASQPQPKRSRGGDEGLASLPGKEVARQLQLGLVHHGLGLAAASLDSSPERPASAASGSTASSSGRTSSQELDLAAMDLTDGTAVLQRCSSHTSGTHATMLPLDAPGRLGAAAGAASVAGADDDHLPPHGAQLALSRPNHLAPGGTLQPPSSPLLLQLQQHQRRFSGSAPPLDLSWPALGAAAAQAQSPAADGALVAAVAARQLGAAVDEAAAPTAVRPEAELAEFAERRYHVGQRVLWCPGGGTASAMAAVVTHMDTRSDPLLYTLELEGTSSEAVSVAMHMLPLFTYRQRVMARLPVTCVAGVQAPGPWARGEVEQVDLLGQAGPMVQVDVAGRGMYVLPLLDVQPVADIGEGSCVSLAVAAAAARSSAWGAERALVPFGSPSCVISELD